jgi:hypothetical protein
MEEQTGPITSLIPEDWFEDTAAASAWVRIYSVLFLTREEFSQFGDSVTRLPHGDLRRQRDPLLVAFGHPRDIKALDFSWVRYAEETGRLRVEMKVEGRQLPDTNVMIIGTAYRGTEGQATEPEVKRRLDAVAALLCVHTGLNFMRDILWEGEVKLAASTEHTASPVMKMPQPQEGPFINQQNWGDFRELLEALDAMPAALRNRIRLGLDLLNAGMRKDEGFFEYWTALEVLVDGRSGKILARMAALYGVKNHRVLAQQTGFRVVSGWRNDFFHRGIRPHVTADVERYLQLLFLDLLRAEIRLKPRYHLPTLLRAPGYNFTPLGLSDSRTDKQKAQATHRQ